MEVRERLSISISFPDKFVFLTTKASDNLFLILLCHNVGGTGFVFLLQLKRENGSSIGA